MPLTLSPELETQLAVVAAQRGLAPIDTLAQLLSEAAANAEHAEREEIMAALRRSTEQFAAGQWQTPEQLDALLAARRP